MASTAKKPKLQTKNPFEGHSTFESFLKEIENDRTRCATSVLDFTFNKGRVRVLSNEQNVPDNCEGVMYWTSRDARIQDNWSFLFAQKLALKNEVPLHICFCLLPTFMDASYRHFHFLLKGLEKLAAECKQLDMSFHLLEGAAPDILPAWVSQHKIGAIICDFSPLKFPMSWVETLKKNLPKDVPLIQVDAHNIVPCWIASDKLEYAARTIRTKINLKLDEFLTDFPPVIKHPYKSKFQPEEIDWLGALESRNVDKSVKPCDWAKPGTEEGFRVLYEFLNNRIQFFAQKRNDPLANALSNLSPWFHFGQISAQRVILSVQKLKSKYTESVNVFCEEAIVRRELSDNFCYYNEHYDSVKGANEWARNTLDQHRQDKRAYIYDLNQLRNSKTHDDLWNSAQIQLVNEGKMHGFLRMYWAKKILEWTPSPETALQYAIYLNDFYSYDGRDPNGFVGCMWSICGIHDQGWKEREIFGKIRYMNYAGCKRKFDINAFISRHGGKAHKYTPAKSNKINK